MVKHPRISMGSLCPNRKRAALIGVACLFVLSLLAGCAQTSGPGTLTPSPAKEPKRLEERIVLNAAELAFADATGALGGPFTVSSGKVVGIHVKNVDDDEHELVFGRTAKYENNVPDGYAEPLFESVPADVFVYMPAKVEVATEGKLAELELEPQGELWVRATFPADAKGTWEVGCFVPGHYQAGMKAAFTIV